MRSRQPVATAFATFSHPHQHHPGFATPHFAQHPGYHEQAFAPVGSRPLQLPLQQQQQQQQHHHSAEQPSLAAGFQHPNFRLDQYGLHQRQPQQQLPPQHQHHLSVRTRAVTRQQQQQQQAVMSHEQNSDELAELQKASNEWEPEVTGPLVGERISSTNITNEYASADPVYQQKTAALPQKYSHYRTVRGDGKCGWRAVGFGYFEALIRYGDSNKFLEEEARLRSMINVIGAAGIDTLLIEDFADEALDILRMVRDSLHAGSADEVLHKAFNDDMKQNYVITYLRTLTTAWMKTRQGDYAPWLMNESVEHFCDNRVMPMNAEIDNVSLSALKDVLLSPAGIALEVLYLDRTEGGEVNMHRFDPVNHAGGITVSTVRLLYRPGHYDILYKAEDLPPPPAPIPTYLQFGAQYSGYIEPIRTAGMDFMAHIPGMSFAYPHQSWGSASSYDSMTSDFLTGGEAFQQCIEPIPIPAPAPTPASTTAPQPQIQAQQMYMPAPATQLMAPPTEMPQQELAIRTVTHAPSMSVVYSQQLTGPFRASAYQYDLEDGFVQAASQIPFQTVQFKNSHYNTAHYLNPDFQPEEWRPDDEYVTSSSSKPIRYKTNG